MINDFVEVKRFLLLDGSEPCGVIETDMPGWKLKELMSKYGFKYKKEVVAMIKGHTDYTAF